MRFCLPLLCLAASCATAPLVLEPRRELRPTPISAPAGDPTVTWLLLRYRNGNFELVTSTAKRGTLTVDHTADRLSDLRAGDAMLIDYRIIDPQRPERTGSFIVDLVSISEYQDDDVPYRIRIAGWTRIEEPLVAVKTPFANAGATIELARRESAGGDDPRAWRQISAGSIVIP